MKHFILLRFWDLYAALPKDIQNLADKNYELLKRDPFHPSLHFKKIQRRGQTLWSARVGQHYRVLGVDKPTGVVWFWIGTHAEYDKLIS